MIYGVWCEFYTRTLPSLWKTAETKTAIKDTVNYVRQVLRPYRTTGARETSQNAFVEIYTYTGQFNYNVIYTTITVPGQ